jgi:hypothetical protein
VGAGSEVSTIIFLAFCALGIVVDSKARSRGPRPFRFEESREKSTEPGMRGCPWWEVEATHTLHTAEPAGPRLLVVEFHA